MFSALGGGPEPLPRARICSPTAPWHPRPCIRRAYP